MWSATWSWLLPSRSDVVIAAEGRRSRRRRTRGARTGPWPASARRTPRSACTPSPTGARRSRRARRPDPARVRAPTGRREVALASAPYAHTPADAGRPVHDVRRGSSPLVGRFVAGDATQHLAGELPRRGGFVPAHDVAGELPPPEALLAAAAPVARVQQQRPSPRCRRAPASAPATTLRTSLMAAASSPGSPALRRP